MNKVTWIFISIGVVLVLATIGIYNTISNKDEAVSHAWGNLDSCLQRRYDLIPNLVSTVKGYAAHESKTLQAVIEARAQVGKISLNAEQLNDETTMAAFMRKQNELQSAMHKLMVVVESYPDLKANANFLDLQHQLEGTENRINYSRNQLNNAVKDFNYSIRKFPNSMVNFMFVGLEKKHFFQAPENSKIAPIVKFED